MAGVFLKVEPQANPILLVTFSQIDTRPGYFAHYKVIQDLPYAKIFLNCPDNNYYLRTIPDVGDNVREIAARLKKEIAALQPKRVVFFGNSMGGYGALLFGALLNVDLTIALGPEVLLGIPGGAMRHAAKDKTVKDDPHACTLPEIVRGTTCGERLCIFGEKAIADMFSALSLDGTGVTSVGIRNAYHSLAPYLHATHGLAAVIADIVARGTAAPTVAALRGDLLSSPRLIRRLYRAVHVQQPVSDFAEIGALITSGASVETLSYAWLAYGQQLFKTGALRRAFAYVLAAALANPRDIEAYTLLLRFPEGRKEANGISRSALLSAVAAHRFVQPPRYFAFLAALLINGEATPSDVLAAISAVPLQPNGEAKIHMELAQLLSAHGEFERAEIAAREAVARLPNDDAAVMCLADVLAKTGNCNEALAAIDDGLSRLPANAALQRRRAELATAPAATAAA